jgi:hypothetical protein
MLAVEASSGTLKHASKDNAALCEAKAAAILKTAYEHHTHHACWWSKAVLLHGCCLLQIPRKAWPGLLRMPDLAGSGAGSPAAVEAFVALVRR